jgi:hypothetical protein
LSSNLFDLEYSNQCPNFYFDKFQNFGLKSFNFFLFESIQIATKNSKIVFLVNCSFRPRNLSSPPPLSFLFPQQQSTRLAYGHSSGPSSLAFSYLCSKAQNTIAATCCRCHRHLESLQPTSSHENQCNLASSPFPLQQSVPPPLPLLKPMH